LPFRRPWRRCYLEHKAGRCPAPGTCRFGKRRKSFSPSSTRS